MNTQRTYPFKHFINDGPSGSEYMPIIEMGMTGELWQPVIHSWYDKATVEIGLRCEERDAKGIAFDRRQNTLVVAEAKLASAQVDIHRTRPMGIPDPERRALEIIETKSIPMSREIGGVNEYEAFLDQLIVHLADNVTQSLLGCFEMNRWPFDNPRYAASLAQLNRGIHAALLAWRRLPGKRGAYALFENC